VIHGGARCALVLSADSKNDRVADQMASLLTVEPIILPNSPPSRCEDCEDLAHRLVSRRYGPTTIQSTSRRQRHLS